MARAHLISFALFGAASVKYVMGLWSVYTTTGFPKIYGSYDAVSAKEVPFGGLDDEK